MRSWLCFLKWEDERRRNLTFYFLLTPATTMLLQVRCCLVCLFIILIIFGFFELIFGNSTKMSEVALTLTRNKRWRISDIEDCVVGSETQDRCWKFLEFGEWKRQIWLWLVIFFKTSVCSESKMLYCWFAMINFGVYFLNTDLELWSSSICLWVRRFALDWIHMNWII